GAHPADLVASVSAGGRCSDLEREIGGLKQCRWIGFHRHANGAVLRLGKTSRIAGARLDGDIVAILDQLLARLGYESYAPLAGGCFLRHNYPHLPPSSKRHSDR